MRASLQILLRLRRRLGERDTAGGASDENKD